MPFVMGIEKSLMNIAQTYLNEEDSIYLVYIHKNLVDISSNKKEKKVKRRELL